MKKPNKKLFELITPKEFKEVLGVEAHQEIVGDPAEYSSLEDYEEYELNMRITWGQIQKD